MFRKKKAYQNYLYGSAPNVINAINNLPLSMRKTYENNTVQNTITIYYNSSFSWLTNQKQIFTQGLLTLALIDFLESLNYKVNLKFFSMSQIGNQILYIDIILKSPGEKINLQKTYFAFCNASFFRRIIFRVIETSKELDGKWNGDYGTLMMPEEVKNVLKINDNIIFINDPALMNMHGFNNEKDIETFFDAINLGRYVSLDTEKFNICDDKNVLKLRK